MDNHEEEGTIKPEITFHEFRFIIEKRLQKLEEIKAGADISQWSWIDSIIKINEEWLARVNFIIKG